MKLPGSTFTPWRNHTPPRSRHSVPITYNVARTRPSNDVGYGDSENRLQDDPSVRNEHHDQTQHAAHDDRCRLAILDVHPDEHEALDRQHDGREDSQLRLPVERARRDERDRAHELQDAEAGPGCPWQRAKGWYVGADLVEHEDFHDA